VGVPANTIVNIIKAFRISTSDVPIVGRQRERSPDETAEKF
jgi:hypothetical protein